MAVPLPSNSSTNWKEISLDPTSGVVLIHQKLHLNLPPYYLADLKKSVKHVVDSRLIRYESELGGILAGYGRISVLKSKAETLFNLSDLHIDIEGDFYVFKPEVGQELTGIVNKKSPGHIGCLVHNLFNVSLHKPFGLAILKWLGNSAKLLDKVTFTITRIDLQSQVPYIEGDIVNLIPQTVSDDSLIKQRSSSDSGVSVASDDSPVTPEEESMEKPKNNKLSISQRRFEARHSAKQNNETTPTTTTKQQPNHTPAPVDVDSNLENPSQEKEKMKRKLSPGSIMQDTPKNKKFKQNSSSENEYEIPESITKIASSLFSVMARKNKTVKEQSKKEEATNSVSSTTFVEREESGIETLPEESGNQLVNEKSCKTSKQKLAKSESKILLKQVPKSTNSEKVGALEESENQIGIQPSPKKVKTVQMEQFSEMENQLTAVKSPGPAKKLKKVTVSAENSNVLPSSSDQRTEEIISTEKPLDAVTPKSKKKIKEVDAVTPKPIKETKEVDAVTPKPKKKTKEVDAVTPKPIKETKEVDAVTPKPIKETKEVDAVTPKPKKKIKEVLPVDEDPKSAQQLEVSSKKSKELLKPKKKTEKSIISSATVIDSTTPSKKSKKKTKEASDEEDHESIIRQLLERSLPVASPNPVSKSKKLTKKQASTSKTSSDISSPVKIVKAASPEKSLKTTVKSSSMKNSVDVATTDEVIKTGPLKKKSNKNLEREGKVKKKIKSEIKSDKETDHEEAVLKILQKVQPKDSKLKKKTTEPKKSRRK